MELALPSGSLESAYAAFQGGADAIYLGLDKFSARSRATNFTYEDLEKILSYSKANNKKVYVVLNTLVEQFNINEVNKTLKRLSFYPIDAIIVQDLGIVNLVKTYFPNLELHASTQLAVHSVDAVKYLKSLGFTRVVLSRELSLKQIKEIRESCKDIEIKVFIHGAMCYGFSGLCTASAQLTNKSANQGQCTQICRRFFEDKESLKSMFPFSMKDLDGTNQVLELEKIGIDSLKIEGRMKSPNYCFKTARHYRYILDHKKINDTYYLEMLTSFSRSNKSGYLENKDSLIDYKYSEHNGILLSDKITKNNNILSFKLNHSVSNYDGLLILEKVNNEIDNTIKLSLQNFKINNKKVVKANKNDVISIYVKEPIYNINNCKIYKISDSQSNTSYSSDKYPLFKNIIPTVLTCEKDKISLKANYFNQELKIEKTVTSEIANNKEAINKKIEDIFNSSPSIFLSQVTVNSLFAYPLKEVKALKRDWYELINNSFNSYCEKDFVCNSFNKINSETLVKRSLLFNEKNHPWTSKNKAIEIDGKSFIVLRPIILNEKEEKEDLYSLYNSLVSENKDIYIGLNNIAHIQWVKDLKAKIFIDWYLFATNSESSKLFSTINNLVGGYTYYEFNDYDTSSWAYNTTKVDQDAKMPFFISLACYRKNVLNKSCKDCDKNFKYIVSQNGKDYQISCDNCISVTQAI